jgi:hypothetical protein
MRWTEPVVMSRISAIRHIFIAKLRPATWRSQPCPSAARRGAPSSPRGCSSSASVKASASPCSPRPIRTSHSRANDFNPEHVAHARRLIEGAGLSNVSVKETGFEEAAARGGDNDVDVVGGARHFQLGVAPSPGRHRRDELCCGDVGGKVAGVTSRGFRCKPTSRSRRVKALVSAQ